MRRINSRRIKSITIRFHDEGYDVVVEYYRNALVIC